MSKKLSFNKDRIWAGIESDQNRKRRKKILPYFIFLAIGLLFTTIMLPNHEIQIRTELSLDKEQEVLNKKVKSKPYSNSAEGTNHTNGNYIKPENGSQVEMSQVISEPKATTQTKTNSNTLTISKARSIPDISTSSNSTGPSTVLIRKTHKSSLRQKPQSKPQLSSYNSLPTLVTKPLYNNLSPTLSLASIFNPETQITTKQKICISKHQIYFQSSFYGSGFVKNGSIAQQNIWNASQTYNFGTASSAGLELQLSNKLLLRAGLEISIISNTYRYKVITVENNINPNDTIDIYENLVVLGDRNEITTNTRSIVKNNESYRIGVPLAIGYTLSTDVMDIKFLLQTTINYWQNFQGIMNDLDNFPVFDNESQNEYFTSSLSYNLSSSLLFSKSISKHLDFNLGLSYAPIRSSNDFTQDLEIGYRGLGVSTGLSYNLR